MENLKPLNLTRLSRNEMKNIAGGTETCTQRADRCIQGLPCTAGSYGTFATCVSNDISGCSPLHEFELLCPNAGM